MHKILEHVDQPAAAARGHRFASVQPRLVQALERARFYSRIQSESNSVVEIPEPDASSQADRSFF